MVEDASTRVSSRYSVLDRPLKQLPDLLRDCRSRAAVVREDRHDVSRIHEDLQVGADFRKATAVFSVFAEGVFSDSEPEAVSVI